MNLQPQEDDKLHKKNETVDGIEIPGVFTEKVFSILYQLISWGGCSATKVSPGNAPPQVNTQLTQRASRSRTANPGLDPPLPDQGLPGGAFH